MDVIALDDDDDDDNNNNNDSAAAVTTTAAPLKRQRSTDSSTAPALTPSASVQVVDLCDDDVSRFSLDILPTSHPEYSALRKLFEGAAGPGGMADGAREFELVEVVKISNGRLLTAQTAAQAALMDPSDKRTWTKYHATTYKQASAIARLGFQVTGSTKRGLYGAGVYLFKHPCDGALSPSATLNGDGIGTLLQCAVYVGGSKTVGGPDPTADDLRKRRLGRYDSVYIPPHAGVYQEEFVVYDGRLVLPTHIVRYKLKPRVIAPLALAAAGGGGGKPFTEGVRTIRKDQYPIGSDEDNIFRLAESQYLRLTCWSGPGVRPDVKQVDWHRVPALEARYAAARAELGAEMLVFHGTDVSNIPSIMAGGLKVGGKGVAVAVGQAYGQGIYVGLHPDVSKLYVKGGKNQLILCKLVKGPSLPMLAPTANTKTMGHYAPAAKLPLNHAMSSFGEFYVVYQPQQLLPFAVIHF